MATKVKPTRLQITGTPQAGRIPAYVDKNTFAWTAGGGGGGASFGRFLSLWDCTTGQPISFPEATPYLYLTGDYYIVETVSSATPPVNYRPDGSSYAGTASSVTESDEVEVGDTYVYDGTAWLLQSNHGKTVTFANIAGDPYDNANLDSALDAKQDVLVSGTNIKTVNNNSLVGSGDVSVGDMKYTDYNWTTLTGNNITLALNSQITPAANFTINAPGTIKDGQEYILRVTSGGTVYAITLGTNMSNPNNVDTTLTANSVDQFVFLAVGGQLELQPRDKDTTYTAGTGISISAQNEISNTGVTSFNGSTGAITYTAPVTSVNTQTGAVVLDADDISDTGTTNLWTNATEKSTWSGKQDALTLPATPTNGHLVTWGANNKTLADGGAVPTGIPSQTGQSGKFLTTDGTNASWGKTQETTSVTLIAAGWNPNTQSVIVLGVTSSNTVIISPEPSSISDYVAGGVYCSAQGTDYLTFTCATAPSNDVTVNVVILK